MKHRVRGSLAKAADDFCYFLEKCLDTDAPPLEDVRAMLLARGAVFDVDRTAYEAAACARLSPAFVSRSDRRPK